MRNAAKDLFCRRTERTASRSVSFRANTALACSRTSANATTTTEDRFATKVRKYNKSYHFSYLVVYSYRVKRKNLFFQEFLCIKPRVFVSNSLSVRKIRRVLYRELPVRKRIPMRPVRRTVQVSGRLDGERLFGKMFAPQLRRRLR